MFSPFRTLALSLLTLALAGPTLRAEEGMWTFDNLPLKKLQAAYGWAPDQAWLDHVRRSALRFGGGCSASFVSADGLVLTNHHCGRDHIQRLSTREKDYIKQGFAAERREDELKVPGLEVRTLELMENITDRVARAVKPGMAEKAAQQARETEIEAIRAELAKKTGLDCQPVSLYQGGEHWIYGYRKHSDVRLVFAPEQQMAHFGGDFDNFTYPRHELDFALFRVYEDGKPYRPAHFLRWTQGGLKAGDLTFVVGHPGRTNRQETFAQMRHSRDVALPLSLKAAELRKAALVDYAKGSDEARRQVATQILGIENGLKARSGYLAGLRNPAAMSRIEKAEQELRAKVARDPKLRALAGGSWDKVGQALKASAGMAKELTFVDSAWSTLLGHALAIVRISDQEALPPEQRKPEFSEARLKAAKARVLVTAPYHPEQEAFLFGRGLEAAARELGAGHPYVKAMLGGKAPAAVAKAAVADSRLGDPAARKALLEGGRKAVAESQDPMILLARKLAPLQQALRDRQKERVQSVLDEHNARIAKARFAVYGKNTYPDATGTLRLTYGPVAEYPANGTLMQPFTTIGGLFDRHDGWGGNAAKAHEGVWMLPQRWLDKRSALDPSMPYNFAHRVDIIGGNSGSPVVDRKGEVVGLIFDGNIEMLPGNYYYDESVNRGVSLDARAILHALDKVYGASALTRELTGN